MVDPVTRMPSHHLAEALTKIRESMGSYESSKNLQFMVPGFKTQKGIYKPRNSDYALWIRQTIRGTYPDQEPDYLPDGSWYYKYAPEANNGMTDLSLSTNKALFRSMENEVPLGVFIQREFSSDERTYEVLGLAYVEDFDGTHFIIHGEPIDVESKPVKKSEIPPFIPFDDSPKRTSSTLLRQRIRAFQAGIRRLYHEKCSLCEIGFHFQGQPIGIDAAHLIPFSNNGTSKDLRNGILLCNNHHSLFDKNLWTLDEDYRVVVKDDKMFRKSALSNHILKAEGRRLQNLPDNNYDFPAIEAIKFRLEWFEN